MDWPLESALAATGMDAPILCNSDEMVEPIPYWQVDGTSDKRCQAANRDGTLSSKTQTGTKTGTRSASE